MQTKNMNFLKVSGLNITEDSYGNNMLDSYRTGIPGYDIVERDDGCFTLNGDSDAYTEEYEKWDDIQKTVEKKITKGRILDIGGTGFADVTILSVPEVNFSFILPLISFVIIAIYAYRAVKVHK